MSEKDTFGRWEAECFASESRRAHNKFRRHNHLRPDSMLGGRAAEIEDSFRQLTLSLVELRAKIPPLEPVDELIVVAERLVEQSSVLASRVRLLIQVNEQQPEDGYESEIERVRPEIDNVLALVESSLGSLGGLAVELVAKEKKIAGSSTQE